MQQHMLLQRNLIYTGITRAEKLLMVVGQEEALRRAVRETTGRARGVPGSVLALKRSRPVVLKMIDDAGERVELLGTANMR